jgi:hypothetical protein
MAQPAQVFGNGYEYVVIDNGAAGNVGGIAGAPGYDTINTGASAQGLNIYGQGTIPDFVKSSTTYNASPATTANPIRFKNPA